MKRVIVIDDDTTAQRIIELLVEIKGYSLEICNYSSSQSAYDDLVLHRRECNVILLDLRMPVMTGLQFLTALDRVGYLQDREIEIYITSASIDVSEIMRCKTYPSVKGFISKPVRDGDLKLIAG